MFKRLIENLTGKRTSDAKTVRSMAETRSGQDESTGLITVYDVHGREMQVSRADWLDKMLLPQILAKWDQPDELYGLIVNALNDGFVAEVEPASGRLIAIDPIAERSHVIRAIVLMKLNRLDQAERTLRDAMSTTGETGTILTNLAKIQDARGDKAKVDATLWKALTLDPNQENGLLWWLARAREHGGETGYLAALDEADALPGSWRAKLLHGRHLLDTGKVVDALDAFKAVANLATKDREALLTISGDLGNAGKISELVDIVAPIYDPAVHMPQVGLNLLQAYLRLDRLDEGEALLNRLYALNMPPFKQHLDAVAGQYQERRRQASQARPLSESELRIAQLPFDLPVWMYGLRDPQWLFVPKPADARKVMFLMLGKASSGALQAEEQREDDIGRLSRAIPLYMAESVYEWTPAHGQSLVAVVEGGGPALFGAQDESGERETAARLAEYAEVLVQGSISSADGVWIIDMGIWDTARVEMIGRESVSAGEAELAGAVLDLERKILARLGGVQPNSHDSVYTRPTLEQMRPYLEELAQSLMLCLLANGMIPKDSMWGERNMLEWPLRMALHWPNYVVLKAMYFSGISHAARYHSDVLGEFEERSFALLRDMNQARSPLADLGPLLLHAFNKTDAMAAVRRETADARRLAWLDRVTGQSHSA